MNFIIRYDDWLRDRTKDVLDWLYEWFSISQKVVERALICGYVLGQIMTISAFALKGHRYVAVSLIAICAAILIMLLFIWHNDPSVIRRLKHEGATAVMCRMAWQFIVAGAIAPPYVSHWFGNVGLVLQDSAFIAFLYVVSVYSDGERGRKRKMAWAKLKELFSWLPEPVPEGV